MTRALVLSGGGARGAFQAGVVEGLVEDQNLDFEVLHGVSTGALNAAFLAQASTAGDSLANLAQRSRELGQMWRSFTGNSSIYTRRFGGYAGLALGANSLYDNAPLRRLIEQNLDVTALSASGRFFACGFVSLKSGRYAERTHQHARITEGVIASASIPIAFPFVEARDANGELTDVLVDGGVRNLSPLGSVFHQEPAAEASLSNSFRIDPSLLMTRIAAPTTGPSPTLPDNSNSASMAASKATSSSSFLSCIRQSLKNSAVVITVAALRNAPIHSVPRMALLLPTSRQTSQSV